MNFSKEFFDWTNTKGDYYFEIRQISSTMLPGDRRTNSCDGIGFVSMYKEMDGTLTLEMKINDNETQFRKFIEVKSEFLNNHQSSQHL